MTERQLKYFTFGRYLTGVFAGALLGAFSVGVIRANDMRDLTDAINRINTNGEMLQDHDSKIRTLEDREIGTRYKLDAILVKLDDLKKQNKNQL